MTLSPPTSALLSQAALGPGPEQCVFWSPVLAATSADCRKPSACTRGPHSTVLKKYHRAAPCPHPPLNAG